jgi:hypothetical protein
MYQHLQQLSLLFASILLIACSSDDSSPHRIDNTAPVITEVDAVVTPATDKTPTYTFNSTTAGTILYNGSCSSTVVAKKGNNTLSFRPLAVGTYSNCSIQVKDASNNVSNILAIPTFTITAKYRGLNDTGIVLCGDYAYSPGSGTHNNDVDCQAVGSTQTVAGVETANGFDPVPAGQDAVYGRDANPATNDNSDGWKGFSFTKLGADGSPLVIQNATWSDAGNETAGTKWSCVLDNVTQLVWEVKTNDSGLRDKDWVYTWYNSTGVNDGGDHGVGDLGVGVTTGYETIAGAQVGSDNCFNQSRCDTEKYIEDVNAAQLCGFGDWRLPLVEELKSVRKMNDGSEIPDVIFFPNTNDYYYWTDSPSTYGAIYSWALGIGLGTTDSAYKAIPYTVRLVRDN